MNHKENLDKILGDIEDFIIDYTDDINIKNQKTTEIEIVVK